MVAEKLLKVGAFHVSEQNLIFRESYEQKCLDKDFILIW